MSYKTEWILDLPLLKHSHTIFKKDLYNAVYQFRLKNSPGDSDASQMLQTLLNWKDLDLLWTVKPRLELSTRKQGSLASAIIEDETLDTFDGF
uniref:Uncharacterized protein n=1 Tax=Rhizophagus irregularis (strain DAOM 181602 / DAOM 197198 / MUCL 43194) TaxID=747089 RepID=U9UEG1_RHIID